ncbi:hypothetical protein KAK07_23440 [Ideonella sp. 4Y16]|uniref:hypothetical protein n=1 Tax=Ideonella alba TaxID=2824118 RepID=UPI001B38AB32|nr:hypothetical protein [Ideonella alba]MBQ0946313.1 hypothetical protein [Ideonella alba]
MNLLAFAKSDLNTYAETLFQLEFNHVDTDVNPDDPDAEIPYGFTLWRSGDVHLGWDWVTHGEILLLLAPMNIVTNTKVLGNDGCTLAEREQILLLNAIVHRLPWQATVRQQMWGDSAAPPARSRALQGQALLARAGR